jgi:hypothetical protein
MRTVGHIGGWTVLEMIKVPDRDPINLQQQRTNPGCHDHNLEQHLTHGYCQRRIAFQLQVHLRLKIHHHRKPHKDRIDGVNRNQESRGGGTQERGMGPQSRSGTDVGHRPGPPVCSSGGMGHTVAKLCHYLQKYQNCFSDLKC